MVPNRSTHHKFECNSSMKNIFFLQSKFKITEVATGGFLLKKCSEKFCKIHRKTPVNFLQNGSKNFYINLLFIMRINVKKL